jgi:protein arginine kinase
VVKKVNRALVKCGTFNLYYAQNLSDLTLEEMKEKHLISNALIENKQFGAALVAEEQGISVMIHEEDVIREQCFMKGLRLKDAYKRIDRIDDALEKSLDLAFSQEFGYLTACPSNLGTGLRASVMLFLPALTESGKIGALVREVSKLGLTVRGLYGEGSEAEGFMYQISNEVTLGISEYEILREVENTVLDVCRAEHDEMEKLYAKNQLKTMDKARKSFGVLTNAVFLSYSEFLSHIARVKIGTMLGLLNLKDIESLDELIVSARPANICEQYGKQLSPTDRDLYRAELVGKKLLKLKY